MKIKDYNRPKKSKNEDESYKYMAKKKGPMDEMYRTTNLTLRVRSFGNEMQHRHTIATILRELELRGYDIEVLEDQ